MQTQEPHTPADEGEQPSLFDYPNSPGWQKRDTSLDAAKSMLPRQKTIQARVLEALRVCPLASFELAAVTGISYRSVQPRTAELSIGTSKRPAMIRDSGKRRRDPDTDHQAIVWEIIR